jgi:hypothetical protein
MGFVQSGFDQEGHKQAARVVAQDAGSGVAFHG